MSRRISFVVETRVVAGAVYALAVLMLPALALAGVGPPITTTSPGCFPPSIAADQYVEAAAGGPPLSDQRRSCVDQCRALRAACHKVCSASQECMQQSFGGFLRSNDIFCRSLPNAGDRTSCLAEGDSIASDFHAFLNQDKNDAQQICDDLMPACRLECRRALQAPR
jgi:hypothetical protein